MINIKKMSMSSLVLFVVLYVVVVYFTEQQKEQLQSTLEVVQPSTTWGSSAYNAFFNITGAVANMMSNAPDDKTKRKRVSSIDSSDGFEIIDKNDLN